MKTLKSILFSIAILAVATVANAKSKNLNESFTEGYVINTYVGAVTEGNLKNFTDVLADDVAFTTTQKYEVKSVEKNDVLNFLKNNEGVKQECTTTTSKVKENADHTIYEVDMKYATYTRVDKVTLVYDADSWKISEVNTSYK